MTPKEELRKEFFEEHVLHGLSDWQDMFNWFYEKLDPKFPSSKDLEDLRKVGNDDFSFTCHKCGTIHTGKNDDQLHEICHKCFS